MGDDANSIEGTFHLNESIEYNFKEFFNTKVGRKQLLNIILAVTFKLSLGL